MQFEQVDFIYQKDTPFRREGLKGIQWHIREPNMLAIVGETGSGKSTLVQHLNGLLKPTAGVYSHGSVRLTTPYKKGGIGSLRREIGLVFQFPERQLFHETVEEDLLYGPLNFGFSEVEAQAAAAGALKQVGLSKDFLKRRVDRLSGGEKRRAAIASVLSMRPQILVLDEPTAGLDPAHRVQLMRMLRSLYETRQMTVIWVTHDMEDVLLYAEEMAVLSKGRLVCAGRPVQIFQNMDMEAYGLLKPRVLVLKDELVEKFGVRLPESATDLETVLEQFAVLYRAGKEAGDCI